MKFDLVFEGGGAKGTAFVGALWEFFQRGHVPGRLLGTSAGAITATLLAAGYTVPEMTEALAEKDNGKSVFTDFLGRPSHFDDGLFINGDLNRILAKFDLPFIPSGVESKLRGDLLHSLANESPGSNLFSLVELGGWYTADSFLSWLERKLNEGQFKGRQRNFGGMNLRQFAAATDSELSLVASDITRHTMLILNQRTAPDLPVKWAVRMSMSIPLLWQDVIWESEWGKYAGIDFSADSIVDGGVLSNFPISLFLSDDKVITDVMGDNSADDVIGMLLDEQLAVPGIPDTAPPTWEGIDIGTLKLARRIGGLVDTLMSGHDKTLIDAFEDKVVRLPVKGIGTTEFNMSDERRELLIEAGQAVMKFYLDKLEPSAKNAQKPASVEAPPAPSVAAQANKHAAQLFYSNLLLVK